MPNESFLTYRAYGMMQKTTDGDGKYVCVKDHRIAMDRISVLEDETAEYKEQLKDIHRKNVYMRALAISLEYEDDQITKHIEQAESELAIK